MEMAQNLIGFFEGQNLRAVQYLVQMRLRNTGNSSKATFADFTAADPFLEVQKQTGTQPLEGQRHRGEHIPPRNRGVLYLLMLNS